MDQPRRNERIIPITAFLKLVDEKCDRNTTPRESLEIPEGEKNIHTRSMQDIIKIGQVDLTGIGFIISDSQRSSCYVDLYIH